MHEAERETRAAVGAHGKSSVMSRRRLVLEEVPSCHQVLPPKTQDVYNLTVVLE